MKHFQLNNNHNLHWKIYGWSQLHFLQLSSGTCCQNLTDMKPISHLYLVFPFNFDTFQYNLYMGYFFPFSCMENYQFKLQHFYMANFLWLRSKKPYLNSFSWHRWNAIFISLSLTDKNIGTIVFFTAQAVRYSGQFLSPILWCSTKTAPALEIEN